MPEATLHTFDRWPDVMAELIAGRRLTRELAQEALGCILAGEATEAQIDFRFRGGRVTMSRRISPRRQRSSW